MTNSRIRQVSAILLVVYGAVLINVLVFKHVPMIRIGSLVLNFGGTQGGEANFLPFATILSYLHGEKGLLIGAINIIGNIVLLVPVGLLATLAKPGMKLLHIIAVAVFTGVLIEGLQAILELGIFDIDDVILNGFGVVVGYWIQLAFRQTIGFSGVQTIKKAAFILIGITIISIALITWKTGRFPIGFGNEMRMDYRFKPDDDPCNGTGGTGTITDKDDKSITIRAKNGHIQKILLIKKTIIRSSAGKATEADLMVGKNVTVITTDERMTASLVLVCK